jgi:hypothetical protein
MTDEQMKLWNEAFKAGRRAGQEDVALEILKDYPEMSHEIAQRFLNSHKEWPWVLESGL